MATVEELISTLALADETDRINVNLTTRTINMPTNVVYGVTNDKNVKELKFKMESMYDGVDLSGYKVRINYLNAGNYGDVYTTTPIVENGMMYFSWILDRNVLAYRGNVNFIVCLKNIDSEGNELNELNTTITSFAVLEGLETEEAILSDNPSVIESILLRLDNLESGGTGSGSGSGTSGSGKDGRGISSIRKTSTSGLVDTYTITYSDNTTSSFTVTNGADGVSPTATVSKIGDDVNITITDKNGTTTATIPSSSSEIATLPSTGRAKEIFEDVKVGWNLGNTFDATVTLTAGDANSLTRIDTDAEAPYYETCWGNVVTTKAMIDLVKTAGFNAVRVPITWAQHMYDDGKCTLSRKWIARIREIVDYVLDNDMYCIINTHHDCANYRESVGQGYLMLTGWLSCEKSTYDEVSENFKMVWENIANEFNDYDDRLMFEPFNELMSSRGWVSPNFEEYRVLNDLQQIFVDAVRSTGGNNLTRTLCVTTYQHGKYHLEWLEDPVDIIDNGFIYQVHDYDTNYNQDLDLNTYSYFIDNNIPLFINEMGTITDSLPYEIRVQHAQNFVARARELGIKCFWWDDGGNYVLMDRANTKWKFPEIANALVLGTTTKPADTVFLVNQDMTDISYYQFNGLSVSTDSLGEFSNANSYGAICNTDAISLTGATYAQVKLTRADGYRIQSYALYDSSGTCITCKNTSTSTTNLIIETNGASSMRFVVYNPWGYRNLANFRTSMANDQLAIVVKIS